MNLISQYLNERLELLDGVYGQERQDEYDALLRPYNRLLGPVGGVSVYRPDLLDPAMYSSMARHSPLRLLTRDVVARPRRGSDETVPGGGKGSSAGRAFFGALGEVAERMLTVWHTEASADVLVHATYERLRQQGRRALGPAELPLFAAEQYESESFGYNRFAPDTPLSWIAGTELLTGEPVLVPAQLMLFNYLPRRGEGRIGYATTGGLGFHPSRRRAILHGLFEFVERDAINVRWFCRLAPARVRLDLRTLLECEDATRLGRLTTPHIDEPTVYLQTVDVALPVLTATALDHSRRERGFLSGGGAWSRRERALRQAVFELGQSRNFFKLYDPTTMKDIQADTPVSEMTDFFHAAVYYGYAVNQARLSWYTTGGGTIDWEAVPTIVARGEAEEYAAVIERVAAAGLNPIVVDYDGGAWPGAAVVKVYVPELTPACVPSHPYLGHPRYREVPARLGVRDRPLAFTDLNHDPLPLP